MFAFDRGFHFFSAHLAFVFLGVCTMVASGCDRHRGGKGQPGASSESGPAASMAPGHPSGMQDHMAARPGSPTQPRRANQANGAGPDSATGLAVCDQYLRAVCACSGTHPALKEACAQAKQSAPQWKATSAKDPAQRASVEASCTKALKALTETFHCPAPS
ncbi:MAG: hypothetical protein J7M25_01035 [Deltaproteobacteria bacterium]|nr:hypothetical protein [Deltaproteobacteria bacterium]